MTAYFFRFHSAIGKVNFIALYPNPSNRLEFLPTMARYEVSAVTAAAMALDPNVSSYQEDPPVLVD